MKILMVNNQLYVLGGSETYMFSVGEELVRKGHQVEYYGLKDPENKHGNRYGIYAQKSRNPLNIISNKHNINKFKEILDAFKPDIVHLNLVYFTLTEDIVYEAKRRNIPIVQTIHDPKIVCPCHRFYIEHQGKPCLECVSNLDFSKCITNKCVKGSFIKSWLAVKESNYYKNKKAYELVDKYIFVCRFMMEQHVDHGVRKNQSIVLHNFSRIQKRKVAIKAQEKYVIYFGRISKEKGAETLAKVCRDTPNIKYKVVGSGDKEYLFQNISNCELLGFKSGKELEDLIASAVCSILPSIWYENCPMTVLESIALGTPVIGADIGGIPELIEHGRTGFVFKSGDANELKELIEELYRNDKLAYSMAQNCITNNDLMDVCDYTEKLINIYKSLMRGK